MSDDRLFASNSAIGRRWYFFNIFILCVIAVSLHTLFNNYILPNTISEVYNIIASWILYFGYAIIIITFLALVERRLYDICGKRDNKAYKNSSFVLKFIVLYQIAIIVLRWFEIGSSLPLNQMQSIATLLDIVFLFIVFILGLIKGKISNLTYIEYKKQDKYK